MKLNKKISKLIENIAKKHFHIETLEERGRSSLDFHEVSVIGMQRALEEAYKAGFEAGKGGK